MAKPDDYKPRPPAMGEPLIPVEYSPGDQRGDPRPMTDKQLPATVTPAHIQDLLGRCSLSVSKLGTKTTVVVCTMPNGFELIESSACVDPAKYDEQIGADICLQRITDRLWLLEGYRLQCLRAGQRGWEW